jgi:hypothetical protein
MFKTGTPGMVFVSTTPSALSTNKPTHLSQSEELKKLREFTMDLRQGFGGEGRVSELEGAHVLFEKENGAKRVKTISKFFDAVRNKGYIFNSDGNVGNGNYIIEKWLDEAMRRRGQMRDNITGNRDENRRISKGKEVGWRNEEGRRDEAASFQIRRVFNFDDNKKS